MVTETTGQGRRFESRGTSDSKRGTVLNTAGPPQGTSAPSIGSTPALDLLQKRVIDAFLELSEVRMDRRVQLRLPTLLVEAVSDLATAQNKDFSQMLRETIVRGLETILAAPK